MLTCFTWECKVRSSDNLMAALLSHRIGVGSDLTSYPMPLRSARSQMHSWVLLNAAIYLALQEEAATVFCLRAAHETIPEPKLQAYPPMLCCVSMQLAQSESVKPIRLTDFSLPPSVSLRLWVPLRYLTSCNCRVPMEMCIGVNILG